MFLALGVQGNPVSGKVPDVLVINTDSRFADEETAYTLVTEAVRRCRTLGSGRLFKKIDSTLRGNVATETAAMLDAGAYRAAIVAPAAPKNGRIVVGGRCLVNGIPLGTSDIGKDLFNPNATSSVAELFERRFPGQTATIGLSELRKGKDAFGTWLRSVLDAGKRIIIPDAETIDDLRIAASAADDDSLLLVGSSGLAESMNETSPVTGYLAARPRFTPGDILFVIGSLTATTKAQLERARSSTDLRIVTLDVMAMLKDGERERTRMANEITRLPGNVPVAISTFDTVAGVHEAVELAAGFGYTEKRLGESISIFLGSLVRRVLVTRPFRVFFVTGGSTAAGLAEALEAQGIDLLDEVLPGIPFGTFTSPLSGEPLYIVSKSGGFGAETAMVEVLAFLESPSAETGGGVMADVKAKKLKAG